MEPGTGSITALLTHADAVGEIDWNVSIDSTVNRAHEHGTTLSRGEPRAPGALVESQEFSARSRLTMRSAAPAVACRPRSITPVRRQGSPAGAADRAWSGRRLADVPAGLLLGGLVLESGALWSEVATEHQRADAATLLSRDPPARGRRPDRRRALHDARARCCRSRRAVAGAARGMPRGLPGCGIVQHRPSLISPNHPGCQNTEAGVNQNFANQERPATWRLRQCSDCLTPDVPRGLSRPGHQGACVWHLLRNHPVTSTTRCVACDV